MYFKVRLRLLSPWKEVAMVTLIRGYGAMQLSIPDTCHIVYCDMTGYCQKYRDGLKVVPMFGEFSSLLCLALA